MRAGGEQDEEGCKGERDACCAGKLKPQAAVFVQHRSVVSGTIAHHAPHMLLRRYSVRQSIL